MFASEYEIIVDGFKRLKQKGKGGYMSGEHERVLRE